MGCIMTPMPNHLSTLKLHDNRVENKLHHKRVEEKKTKGAEVERMGWEGMREEKRDGENRDKRKDKGWTLPERY